MRIALVTAGVVLVVFAMVAIGFASGDGPLSKLGGAACADLREGASFFQLANAGLDAGLSRREVASAILLGVEDDCPEFEAEFKGTMIYTDWLR